MAAAQLRLCAAVEQMDKLRQEQLADRELIGVRHKVLKSLNAHWSGLVVFVDHPEVPMDNNVAAGSPFKRSCSPRRFATECVECLPIRMAVHSPYFLCFDPIGTLNQKQSLRLPVRN